MSKQWHNSMEHERVIEAPPEVVYDLVADVTRWPVIFAPSLYVRHLELAPDTERFQLWALVNGQVKTWTSRRTRNAEALRIGFEQERTQAPFTSMGGEWIFTPLSGRRTRVVLKHHFSASGDDELGWVSEAVDRNSESELAALGNVAELGHPVDEVIDSFTDTMRLPGTASDAYTFIHHADEWPDRLPHVRRVLLREEQPNVQDMEMDTVTADGSAHTTRSVRICFPDRIVYKQLVPPALLLGHSGSWEFADTEVGTLVTARHTVAINPAAVREVLGSSASLADARSYLREALGGNGRATLAHAGAYAEDKRAAAPVEGPIR